MSFGGINAPCDTPVQPVRSHPRSAKSVSGSETDRAKRLPPDVPETLTLSISRRPVAIKALSPRYLADDHYQRRLRQKARATATLSHPAIATVYALEEFDRTLYLVCDYVP